MQIGFINCDWIYKRLARLKLPALFPVLNQELKQLFRGRVKSASAIWQGRSVSERNIAENALRIKLPLAENDSHGNEEKWWLIHEIYFSFSSSMTSTPAGGTKINKLLASLRLCSIWLKDILVF